MVDSSKVNLSVNDGMDFYANEVSVNFSPMQFILDFKSVVPRVDMRSKNGPVLSLKHNVVLMDTYHAKRFHKMLGDVIKQYEEKYVKIKKPAALTKAEKDAKKTQEKGKSKPVPNYLG